ncbi:MAG TPA: hypothetical protein VFT95_02815, partial [Micromonosporaceae bacterium]|nr:hypothetical protein [Micromonosporaceae bacterium]
RACISDRVQRGLRWLTLVVVAAATVLAGSAGPVCACDCQSATEAEYIQRADLAFEGVVVDVDEPFLPSSDASPVTVRFRVEAVAKGTPGTRVALRTGMDEASCGFVFVPGHRYRVYAVGELTGLCAGNRDLGAAPDVPLEEGWPSALIGVGVAATVLVIAVALLLRRGRRPDSL